MRNISNFWKTKSAAAALLLLLGWFPASMGQDAQKSDRDKIKIADNVWLVVEKSCKPCHSDRGGKMAKAVLNFNRWDKYNRRAQVQKSRAICKMVSKGEMPPAQFVESSPELALTPAQKEMICNWVNGKVLKK